MPEPHGGRLVDATIGREDVREATERARGLPSIVLDPELAAEVENIGTGVFSPLTGFMKREEYEGVLEHMRLPGDIAWTLPVILDVEGSMGLAEGGEVALLEEDGEPLATMRVAELFPFDKERHAYLVFGTTDEKHPGVAATMRKRPLLAGGPVRLIRRRKTEFDRFSLTPMETRVLFKEKGWRQVVGFQTRNVPHLGHEYVQKTALTFMDGIFINPVVGRKKKGDFTDLVILESYEALIDHYYLKERAVMAILSYEMRYAGPREAVFHAIVRKNFGCTHFIVGRDHAGVGDFYGPFEAQEIFDEFPDLGIVPVFFNTFSYCTKCGGVVNEKTCPHGEEDHIPFSGTRIRKMLSEGKIPPPELMRPEVAEIIIGSEKTFVE